MRSVLSRLFISHSSLNNAAAMALCKWLAEQGYDDVFLDINPERGLVAGERWQEALKAAADRCEAVLFLVSPAWLASQWCRTEFLLAKTLHKRIFGLIIEPVPLDQVPPEMKVEWQLCELAGGDRLRSFEVEVDSVHTRIAFREAGLDVLRRGLERAGLDARSFLWPPPDNAKRAPYPGLRALEPQDAAVFFGRDVEIVRGLDRIRGMVETGVEKVLIVLGGSGSGKSSFLRAGLWPRLARNDISFFPLPVIRPETAVISGNSGLAVALGVAFERLGATRSVGRIKQQLAKGVAGLEELVLELSRLAKGRLVGTTQQRPAPAIAICIDQTEELFNPDGASEAETFLDLAAGILAPGKKLPVLVIATIRSDRYELLQGERRLGNLKQELFNLPPLSRTEFKSVIEGPARRVVEGGGKLDIDPALTERLIAESEGADALPLLAFILERLYADYGSEGKLTFAEYKDLGGVQGSIEAAIARALADPGCAPAIPATKEEQFAFLRAAFIPWLARIDPETGVPMRRMARINEIPEGARAIVERLVEARLLVSDRRSGFDVIEVAHESLLRQWPALTAWLQADADDLKIVEGIERAVSEWARNGRNDAWLDHRAERLTAAERIARREDFHRRLGEDGDAYLSVCRARERKARARARDARIFSYAVLVGIILGLVGVIKQDYVNEQWNWYGTMRPYRIANIDPYVLKPERERALKPGDVFRECANDCPEMIVVPAGEFMMGSPVTEEGRDKDEDDGRGRQHSVTIAAPFAVSTFVVTFADWDACVSVGGCPKEGRASDNKWGRGNQPVIYVGWDDAKSYAAWLSTMTGKVYRLLTEAEWEYAARAGTMTAYFWGNDIGKGNANCNECGSQWDNRRAAPAGSFKPNALGLHDMVGNVWQWVEDCYHSSYEGAPADGSAWIADGDCTRRVVRGGSWYNPRGYLRSALRYSWPTDSRDNTLGFRVARTLTPSP